MRGIAIVGLIVALWATTARGDDGVTCPHPEKLAEGVAGLVELTPILKRLDELVAAGSVVQPATTTVQIRQIADVVECSSKAHMYDRKATDPGYESAARQEARKAVAEARAAADQDRKASEETAEAGRQGRARPPSDSMGSSLAQGT